MIRTGTPGEAAANRRKLTLANGTGYFKSEFIASPFGEALAPQSFLVEQDPDSVILPHFHVQNEFQVVVKGSGSIGRHAVRPLTVHYTGAHTGYGPITAGPGGLWYFTLRPAMDQGALFLPEARERMQKVPKRHLLGRPLAVSEDCSRRSEALCEEAVPPQVQVNVTPSRPIFRSKLEPKVEPQPHEYLPENNPIPTATIQPTEAILNEGNPNE